MSPYYVSVPGEINVYTVNSFHVEVCSAQNCGLMYTPGVRILATRRAERNKFKYGDYIILMYCVGSSGTTHYLAAFPALNILTEKEFYFLQKAPREIRYRSLRMNCLRLVGLKGERLYTGDWPLHST